MDAREQNNYDIFRRDVYRFAVSNESQESRRIVRSVDDDDDDDENLEDENLEALRRAALQTMRSKCSYARGGFNTTSVGGTRRVSLGWEDKSDLQIVTLERQDSFSSSTTDYEEIDLSTPPGDKRTFPDSEDSDTDVDHDNYVDSEDKYVSDSQKEEQSLDAAFSYEEEEKEMTDDGSEVYNNSDDDENDVLGDNEMFDYYEDNHHDGENMFDDIDNTGANDALSDDETVENENGQQTDEDNVEQESNEDILGDIDKNSTNDLEDEICDSDNEINILNDISITIANESLTNVPANSTSKEILDGSGQENDLSLFQYSNGEQLDDANVISSQRIIISCLDSKGENDSEVKEQIKQPKEQHAITSKKSTVNKEEKMDSCETSVPAASETSKAVISSGKVAFSFAKVDLSSAEVDFSLERKQSHTVSKIKKAPDSNVKPSTNYVKRNSQPSTVEKPKVKCTLTSKSNKDIKQEVLPMENAGNKTKEMANVEEKAQKVNKNSLVKGDNDNKIASISKPERLDLNAKNEDRDKMDFDQLSIEDEDSDFVEEEENLPAVKSKVGLNKIPSERLRTRRSSTRENNRKRRRSYSPERSRISSRSYQSQSLSRDRLRDQHLRDRSRERFRRRSQSPPLKNRTYRRNYSRHERSHSRDRTQNRIASDGKNKEHRRYRSRSRSGSRLKSGRTDEKDLKSNVNKQMKKNSVKVSELKTKMEKDEGASMKSQQRKNIMVQKSSDKKVTAKITESKSSKSASPASNSTKVKSKPSAVQVEIKQPKDLRSRLTVKNMGQDVNTCSSKKSVEKDSTKLVRERQLDERIQKIKQQNEVILKRAKEIHAEKLKFS